MAMAQMPQTSLEVPHNHKTQFVFHWFVYCVLDLIGAEDPASVLVYDSLFHQCSPHVQQQVAAISRTKSSQINAHFVDVQCQSRLRTLCNCICHFYLF